MIIDTSSIVFGLSYGKDTFEIAERRLRKKAMVSRGVLRELSGMTRNKGKRGAMANTALSLIRVKKVKVDNNTSIVDSWVYRMAATHENYAIVTNDTELFRKASSVNQNVFKLSRSGILKR